MSSSTSNGKGKKIPEPNEPTTTSTTTTTEPRKAIAYLRVSGVGQVDGDGFDRQRDAISKFAESRGMEVVAEYRDEGVSGTRELASRPGLANALVHIESNGVRCVLIENASRLARDLMVQEIILQQFRAAGVSVIDTSTGYDMASIEGSDPTQTLIRQVLGAVMQFDKEMLVLKLRAARDRIRAKYGYCEGFRGYGRDPRFPHEREGLQFLLQLYDETEDEELGLQKITAIMNGSRYRPRKAQAWSMNAIAVILERERNRERQPQKQWHPWKTKAEVAAEAEAAAAEVNTGSSIDGV